MGALLLLVKVSLLFAAALAGGYLLRGAPALSRHRLWSGVFAAALVLPLLVLLLPPLAVPVSWLPSDAPAPIVSPAPGIEPLTSRDVSSTPERSTTTALPLAPRMNDAMAPAKSARPWSAATVLAATWAAGALLAASILLLSLFRVRRLARSAAPLHDGEWDAVVTQLSARLGMRRMPRVLISEHVGTPMAGGVVRPIIFVPSGAREWDADCRAVVLAHELAHLSRHDPLRQSLARLALAVYWFHPLAWLAAREATTAREQACDEAVIALGTRPSTYARILMDFADSMPAAARALAALPMIQRSLLEKRLMAILSDHTRPRARRLALVPVLAVAIFTISVAAVQLEPQTAVSGQAAQSAAGSTASRRAAGVPSTERGYVAVAAPGPAASAVQHVLTGDVAIGAAASQSSGTACNFAWNGRSFRGISTTNQKDGTTVITEMVGRYDADLVMLKRFGDLRVCAIAEGVGKETDGSVRGWARAKRIVLETAQGGQLRRMEMGAGGQIVSWQVNGAARPADADAKEWSDRLMALLGPAWELSILHGEVSSKRGEISSIQGQRSSLEGQISSIRGEISSLQGQISSLQGQESSLRGRISSIEGHVSSLQGRISSEQGAISSLQASRWDSDAARRGDIAARIQEHEKAIARVQAEIRAYDARAKIAEVEKEIARLNVDDKIAGIEVGAKSKQADARVQEVRRQIEALEVEKRIDRIEREIEAMNVDRRARDLEAQIEPALERLEETLRRIR